MSKKSLRGLHVGIGIWGRELQCLCAVHGPMEISDNLRTSLSEAGRDDLSKRQPYDGLPLS
jgi:hypothetical protein